MSANATGAGRPPLRDDLKLMRGPATAGGAPTWTLYDPVRQAFFRIGRREFEILGRWEQAPDQIIDAIARETTLRVDHADIEALQRFLTVNRLLQPVGPAARAMLRSRMLAPRGNLPGRILRNYLFFRIPLVRPDAFLSRTLPAVRTATRLFRYLWVPLLLLALFVLVRQWSAFIHTFTHFFTFKAMVLYAAAIFGAKAAHELGHAYAAKQFGLRVPTLGVAFMVLWPILYTDNTDAWRVRHRKARMAIVAAGMLVELAIAILATLLWALLPDGPGRSVCFILASATWISSIAINSIPFMRFDGYYLFSDWLDIPNLHQRAFALGRWWLRRCLLGNRQPPPETFAPGRQRLLIAFALATWLYRLALFTGIALMVYHLFFKALGLLLFAVEIFWFIGRPVLQEVRTWPRLLGETGWTRQSVLFLICLGLLISWLLLPTDTQIRVPALRKPGEGVWIYPPAPGRIRAVHIQNGQKVKAGAILFELASPDLVHAMHLAQSRARLLVTRIKRETGRSDLREHHQVLLQQLAEVNTALAGYRQQMAQLVIRAATDGTVIDMEKGLRPGRWLNPGQRLALLVDHRQPYVEGFVPEALLGRIQVGAAGRFYPDIAERRICTAKLAAIDAAGIRRLEEPYLASIFGGPVPVVQDEDGLKIQQSHYRVKMAPDPAPDAPFQAGTGGLLIRAHPRSRIVALWRRLSALVIRESGF